MAKNMKLSQFTNYTFRVLLYVGLKNDGPASIQEIARAYKISYNHLKKVSAFLVKDGYLIAKRGRAGGLELAKSPSNICVGEVIRKTEGQEELFECKKNSRKDPCPIIGVCTLRVLVDDALQAFYTVIDRVTLADLMKNSDTLGRLLQLEPSMSIQESR